MNDRSEANAKVISLELRFLVDRAIAARKHGMIDVADIFVRGAEALIRTALPHEAGDIGKVASRKGDGARIASRLSPLLSPSAAAAVFVIWSFRSARAPAIRTLADVFGTDPIYQETTRLLCQRLFASHEPTATQPSSIEVASLRCRSTQGRP
ncbi:MAG: hypothetical protein ACT4OF_15915 [Caulobacteraceae bacterium]